MDDIKEVIANGVKDNPFNPTTKPGKVTLVARMLAVSYLLGTKSAQNIPKNISDMMSKGNDGLNWQAFMPLAMSIFGDILDIK